MAEAIKLNEGIWHSGVVTARKLGIDYDDLETYVGRGWLPDRRKNKVGQHMWNDNDLTQCREFRDDWWIEHPDEDPRRRRNALPDYQAPPRPERLYFDLDAAQYMGVDIKDVPGLVAMGWLTDHRNEPLARGRWMFKASEMDGCLSLIQRAREEQDVRLQQERERRNKAMSATQVGEEVKEYRSHGEPAKRVRATAIRETSPTGGRWSKPSGAILTAQEVADRLNLTVETVKSYCVPSVGWKLPDRREKKGDPFFWYESDIEEFNRSRKPFGYTTVTTQSENQKRSEEKEPMNTASPVIESTQAPTATALEVVVEKPRPVLPPKIQALADLTDHLTATYGATDIVATEKLILKVEVTITNPNALSQRVLAPIELRVQPDITVWDVYMATVDQPDVSAYQVVLANGIYYVSDEEKATSPETSPAEK